MPLHLIPPPPPFWNCSALAADQCLVPPSNSATTTSSYLSKTTGAGTQPRNTRAAVPRPTGWPKFVSWPSSRRNPLASKAQTQTGALLLLLVASQEK